MFMKSSYIDIIDGIDIYNNNIEITGDIMKFKQFMEQKPTEMQHIFKILKNIITNEQLNNKEFMAAISILIDNNMPIGTNLSNEIINYRSYFDIF